MKRNAAAVFFCIAAATAQGQPETESAYSEVFYPSANLRIQAYLYKPDGDGPFPVVIYNHGSRDGRERASLPFQYVGKMLTRAGYAVLVPERRGYGKSDGSTWREEVGSDQYRLITRLQAETDDMLAAVEYLRTVRFADARRMGVMGWSFGGIVTMLAASRSTAFRVAAFSAAHCPGTGMRICAAPSSRPPRKRRRRPCSWSRRTTAPPRPSPRSRKYSGNAASRTGW